MESRDSRPGADSQSNLPIYASIVANIAIATLKFIAAAASGSSAMAAEGVHSLVDSADGGLLLIGHRRSKRPADATHPFGYAHELYFWSLMVAVLFFMLGGGISVYHGVLDLLHPEPLNDPTWNYVVLAGATVFDGTSFVIAFRSFRRTARDRGFWVHLRGSKDPSQFAVVLEDGADLIGIALAFLGVFLGHRLRMPRLDGVASIGIGLVLAAIAIVLMIQTKALLLGESASADVLARIHGVLHEDPDVLRTDRLLTMHLGPHDILLTTSVQLAPRLEERQVAHAIIRLENEIRAAVPDVKHVCIDARVVQPGEERA
jgi:cation diffusion facilitator family transporter